MSLVLYVDLEMGSEVVYLSRRDVESIALPMRDIITALEALFAEKGHGRVEMPPKPGIHPRPDAFIHAMPAYVPALGAAGIKWVSGYPQNQSRGLPYIHGLIVLNDPDTGVPTAVMDATWVTAMRTGAATAVSAKHLARSDSRRVGIVACGVQGRSNLQALACVFRLEEAVAYDLNAEVARRFAHEMTLQLGIRVTPVTEVEHAVRDCDMVVTSGPIVKHPQPLIPAGWLAPGSFASAVDFDAYWRAGAMQEIDKLATDDHAQFAYYRADGYFQTTPAPYADLGELAVGKKPGRQSDRERSMAINLGLAIEDMAVAVQIERAAQARGIGTRLPL